MAETPGSPSASAGGFMVNTLPSPAPTTASTTSTIRSVAGLPHPRARALRPGSAKEDQVRHFVSERLMHMTRRFLKKAGKAPPGGDEIEGYRSMTELCKDLDGLINIVWLSGTPNLQIPYLLNIASEFNTWVKGFPPAPAATFPILHKLDHCFASLLSGADMETGEPLPGFENGLRAGMSRTDMVRCKSLVEQARFVMVEVMGKTPGEDDDGDDRADDEKGDREGDDTLDEAESGPEGPGGEDGPAWNEDEERLFMDVARVYENTLVKLGETLGEGGVAEAQMFAD
ncbi:a8201b9f-9144-4eb5-9309-04da7cda3a4a [Thermothielavioides terrestris]|uniref:Meiotic recombination protein DMC1 n=2 Tax=Thermothielavioides terrestris TaxID=2587410 RepID=G2QVV9_THETT|nr:uncharacterized protein THITE_2110985 [Thermothielavioides terrestris NRRL 8126]AEO64691.1 hypothetical protein THITE_2110985 [Thermothielavioides terrestris NRRL 8126]SPQ26456.1 a8201b9f-9144-4eb5-9309-04da7cda3a4a [Thermothielavioides terrestris]